MNTITASRTVAVGDVIPATRIIFASELKVGDTIVRPHSRIDGTVRLHDVERLTRLGDYVQVQLGTTGSCLSYQPDYRVAIVAAA